MAARGLVGAPGSYIDGRARPELTMVRPSVKSTHTIRKSKKTPAVSGTTAGAKIQIGNAAVYRNRYTGEFSATRTSKHTQRVVHIASLTPNLNSNPMTFHR